MWIERFMIIVASLAPRLPAVGLGHVLPDALGLDHPRRLDRHLRLLFLLFVRLLPAISISEMRKEVHDERIVAGRSR